MMLVAPRDIRIIYRCMGTEKILGQLREKGWSDNKIAKEVGVPRSTVNRWRQSKPPEHAMLVNGALTRLLRRHGN